MEREDRDAIGTAFKSALPSTWSVLRAPEFIGRPAVASQVQHTAADQRRADGRRPLRLETVRDRLADCGWRGWVARVDDPYAITADGTEALRVCDQWELDRLDDDAQFDPATGEFIGREEAW